MAMSLDERIEYRRYQITKLSALLAADLAEKAAEDARAVVRLVDEDRS